MKPNIAVAIIGLGCFFPKATSLGQYWRLLYRGEDGISDVPASHWSSEDYYDEDPKKPDHVYCKRGGFLSPVSFDPTEFGIPPNSLEATDTSQILGLMAAKMALEDAGYDQKPFDRNRTSVILGATGTQELVIPLGARLGHPHWRKALSKAGISGQRAERIIADISDAYIPWKENSFPGLLGNVIAGRICNRLDLGGTNCAVDAACASSMSAIHLALLELVSGKSDMVLTGGVDTLNDIFMHMCFSRTGILSPTGDVRPFSSKADGTVLGEGIGILVMKRLSDAQRDGDKIYAVVKGLGSGSDGKSQSIYAPRVEGQEKTLRSAYENAGIDPSTVELIEAHGTGTRVGDRVEYEALSRVFSDAPRENCALGSVKSMIGHTKAAAGAAGLIKATLALHHKVLPPTLKVDRPDEGLGVEKGPFYINIGSRPWLKPDNHPRRAGVSAFGFGGSNFHMVLEEYGPEKTATAWDGTTEIVAISGESLNEIKQRIMGLAETIAFDSAGNGLFVLAAEARAQFSVRHPYRLVWTGTEVRDLQEGLKKALDIVSGNDPDSFISPMPGLYWGGPEQPGQLGFLFPGQGSQYLGMAGDFPFIFPEAFQAIEQAEQLFKRLGNPRPLCEFIYPKCLFTENEIQQAARALQSTRIAQPAIGVVSLAMLRILRRFGVKAGAVAGHSFGELTALSAAGRITEESFLKLAMERGARMAEAQNGNGNGTMLAVGAPLNRLEELLSGEKTSVVLANRNSPAQGVLSGPREDIDRMARICKKSGLACRTLNVSAAFHTPLMAVARDRFYETVTQTQINSDGLVVFSNTTGNPYPSDPEAAGKLLADQILSPVDFVGEVESMYRWGVRTFVEIGPKGVLTGLVRSILKDRPIHALALDSGPKKSCSLEKLARLLAHLAALGHPVDLAQWSEPKGASRKQRMSIPVSGANIKLERKTPEKRGGDRNMAETPPVSKTKSETRTQNRSERPDPEKRLPKRKETPDIFKKEIPQGNIRMSMNPKEKHAPGQIDRALKVVRDGLDSIRALQMQTAEAHKKFLDTQSEASRTLQQMLSSTQRLAESFLATPTDRTDSDHTRQPSVLPETAPDSSGFSRKEKSRSRPETNRTQLSSRPKPPDVTASPDPVKKVMQGRTVAETRVRGDSIKSTQSNDRPFSGLETTMLSVVAELTGYPEEMLGLDMDIESDLGIDSIKRVEILSAMEEKMPDLPAVPAEVMGKAKTLGEVLSHFSTQPENEGASLEQPPVSIDSDNPDGPGSEIAKTLLGVVSELTGYPTEMLALDMDIESDLGIDSIKRVEILSAVEERVPDLPSLSPETMGKMSTLREILSYIRPGGEADRVSQVSDTTMSETPQACASQDQTTDELLSVVSELTGYPTEMLGLDMDIESDLGIDSIKRVEILSALEEKLPGVVNVSAEKMGKMKTLGEILGYISGGMETEEKEEVRVESTEIEKPYDPKGDNELELSSASVRQGEKREVERKIVRLSRAPASTNSFVKIPEGGQILVANTEPELCGAIVKNLSDRGLSARLISLEQDSIENASGLVIVAPESATEDMVKKAFSLARGLSRQLQASGERSGAVFATVTFFDGGFGFRGRGLKNPCMGALAGLAKTASLEWPEVSCRAMDLDPELSMEEAVQRIGSELLAVSENIEIGFDREGGWVPGLVEKKTVKGNIDLGERDVVLVSGGARGVTTEAIMELARRVKPTFVLLGRTDIEVEEPEWLQGLNEEKQIKAAIVREDFTDTSPTPVQVEKHFRLIMARRETRRQIDRLEQCGATVRYHALDIRNLNGLEKILDQTRREFGPVKAVIHGAGVLEDRLIRDKSMDQFDRVFETKVEGLKNLLTATADDPLAYIIIFSSVAARFGNIGQSDYAMANEALNKMAQAEAFERKNCRVVSFNWGPWDGGMVSPALKNEFARRNIDLIPLEAGAKCLFDEMRADGASPVEVVYGASLIPEEKTSGKRQEDQKPKSLPSQKELPPRLSLTFKRDIDIDRYPILESHVLGGKPVVPFALMTEWMGYGALHENPGLMLHGLDDIRIFTGIRLDRDKRTIRLMAGKARKKGSVFEVDVEIRDGYQEGKEVLHTRARAILSDDLPEAPRFDKAVHINSHGFEKGIDDLYETVLFHGMKLRGIKNIISLGERSMVAQIASAPSPGKWMAEPLRSRWIADPLALDSAFQMAIIWSFEKRNLLCLPSYAKSYRQYRANFPREGVTAVFEISHVSDKKIGGDFTFLDSEDNVVASLSGYEAIMDSSLFQAFKPQAKLYASA